MDRTGDTLMAQITGLVTGLTPADALGSAHRQQTLDWLASTDDIFRRAKPRTPSPHLVSYFLLVDRTAHRVLLCDHRLAGLWLPTGGHVEPLEHPYATVRREITEELGITATPDPVHGETPFLLTVTETRGTPETRHTDVSFWFAQPGQIDMRLIPDRREFAGIRWWSPAEILAASPDRFDPHMGRALDALGLHGRGPG